MKINTTKQILKESPDGFFYNKQKFEWYSDGAFTFFVYKDIIDKTDYWIAWDYKNQKILCENPKVVKEIEDSRGRGTTGTLLTYVGDHPSHDALLELLSSLERCVYARENSHYVKCDGRVFFSKKDHKYVMSFWPNAAYVVVFRNKLDDFFNKVHIRRDDIIFETINGKFISYYEFFGTKPREFSDVERKKQEMAKELHIKKAQLDKAILNALQSKPKTFDDLYAALEKQLHMPFAKIKQTFGNIPLRKLVAEQLRGIFIKRK